MHNPDGEYSQFETGQFVSLEEKRGQDWPADVGRYMNEPDVQKYGQDWPSDVPAQIRLTPVQEPEPQRFWDIQQVPIASTVIRRGTNRSAPAASQPGRILRWFNRLMGLLPFRSR